MSICELGLYFSREWNAAKQGCLFLKYLKYGLFGCNIYEKFEIQADNTKMKHYEVNAHRVGVFVDFRKSFFWQETNL